MLSDKKKRSAVPVKDEELDHVLGGTGMSRSQGESLFNNTFFSIQNVNATATADISQVIKNKI